MKTKAQKIFLLKSLLKGVVPIVESVIELCLDFAWKKVEIEEENNQHPNGSDGDKFNGIEAEG